MREPTAVAGWRCDVTQQRSSTCVYKRAGRTLRSPDRQLVRSRHAFRYLDRCARLFGKHVVDLCLHSGPSPPAGRHGGSLVPLTLPRALRGAAGPPRSRLASWWLKRQVTAIVAILSFPPPPPPQVEVWEELPQPGGVATTCEVAKGLDLNDQGALLKAPASLVCKTAERFLLF